MAADLRLSAPRSPPSPRSGAAESGTPRPPISPRATATPLAHSSLGSRYPHGVATSSPPGSGITSSSLICTVVGSGPAIRTCTPGRCIGSCQNFPRVRCISAGENGVEVVVEQGAYFWGDFSDTPILLCAGGVPHARGCASPVAPADVGGGKVFISGLAGWAGGSASCWWRGNGARSSRLAGQCLWDAHLLAARRWASGGRLLGPARWTCWPRTPLSSWRSMPW
jgi:hypothetical protein